MRHQHRTLCGDAVCFLFITPLATLSGWLCVQGALDLHHTNGYEALGLLVLTLALFTIYIFWTMVGFQQGGRVGVRCTNLNALNVRIT